MSGHRRNSRIDQFPAAIPAFSLEKERIYGGRTAKTTGHSHPRGPLSAGLGNSDEPACGTVRNLRQRAGKNLRPSRSSLPAARLLGEKSRGQKVARQFLSALEQKCVDDNLTIDNRSLVDWLAWARDQVAQGDPLVMGAERIFSDIAHVDSWTYRD